MLKRLLGKLHGKTESEAREDVRRQRQTINRRARERGEAVSENFEGSREASLLRAVGGLKTGGREDRDQT